MTVHLDFDEQWVKDYCTRTGAKNPLAATEPAKKPKRRKYNNTPTERDGITFDSKREADRYTELMMMLRAGEIYGVFRQHPFQLPGGVVYRADFVVLNPDGTYTVEDVKSEATAKDKVYRIKKRQMAAVKGIEISEV